MFCVVYVRYPKKGKNRRATIKAKHSAREVTSYTSYIVYVVQP